MSTESKRQRVTTANAIDELGLPAGQTILAYWDESACMFYKMDTDGERVYFLPGDLVRDAIA